MAINTYDALRDTTYEASNQKQVGNNTAFFTRSAPGARELGALVDGSAGIIGTTARGIAKTLETVARPQNISQIKNMTINTSRELLMELDEHGNIKAPKILRNATKHHHDPHRAPTKYKNIQSDYSFAPQKSDKRYNKTWKFPLHTGGKIIKVPALALATLSNAIADATEWRQQQEVRNMLLGKFKKYNRTHTRTARKKLTSRNYTTTGSNSSNTPSREGVTRRSRLPRKRKGKSTTATSENSPKKSNGKKKKSVEIHEKEKLTKPTQTNNNQKPTQKNQPREATQKEKKNPNKETLQSLKKDDTNITTNNTSTQTTESNDKVITSEGYSKEKDKISAREITGKIVREHPDTVFIMGNKENNAQTIIAKEPNVISISDSDIDFDDVEKAKNTIHEIFKKILSQKQDGKKIHILENDITKHWKKDHKNYPTIQKLIEKEIRKIQA